MQIPNNYSINVARLETKNDMVPRHYHYCQIELGNCMGDEAREKFWDICNRFPSEEFDLTLEIVKCSAKTIAERR